MRILATVLLAVSLAGCATGPGAPPPVDQAKAFIAQVQGITRAACAFVPLGETVLAILAAGAFTAPVAIANAICTAVTAPPPPTVAAARGVRPPAPKVGNVPVKGRFVR